jgi:ABC-2 type transport system permease protein
MATTAAEERAERLAEQPMREVAVARGFLSGTTSSWREVWRRRELLLLLTRREVRARYKDSALGLTWSLARPLMQLLIYYIAIGKFLGASRSIPDFHIYIYSGLALWQLFTDTVFTSTTSIVNNSGIIRKIHLPREIFPLSAAGSAIFNYAIQLVILAAACLLTGPGVNWGTIIWALPLATGIAVVWGVALGLFLAAANVYMRDVQHFVEVGIMVGFWLSPIVYSWQMVTNEVGPRLAEIYLANPMTLAVLAMQQGTWVAGGEHLVPDGLAMRALAALAVGLVALFLAQRWFDRMQRDFAQEI